MNPILIDTNAYTAFKRGDAETRSIVQHAPFIGMNITVLGELWAGFKLGTRESQNRIELETFLSSPRVSLHIIDRGTAEQYAAIFASLRAVHPSRPTTSGSPPAPFSIHFGYLHSTHIFKWCRV